MQLENYKNLLQKLKNKNTCWYVSAANHLEWINDWEIKVPFKKPELFVCTDISYLKDADDKLYWHWTDEQNCINNKIFSCFLPWPKYANLVFSSFDLPFAEGLLVEIDGIELLFLSCFNEDFYAFCTANNVRVSNFFMRSHHDNLIYDRRLDFRKLGIKYIWADCFGELVSEEHYYKYLFYDFNGDRSGNVPCIMISKSDNYCEQLPTQKGLIHNDMKFGYIDTIQGINIDCKFDSLDYATGIAKKNGKWGMIDKEGNTVVEFIYESIGRRDIGACGWTDIDKAILNGESVLIKM
jgi:hypothetical protein